MVYADYQAFTATPLYRKPPSNFTESAATTGWVRCMILEGTRNHFDAVLSILEGHSGGVRSVAFSPDGSRIVSGR